MAKLQKDLAKKFKNASLIYKGKIYTIPDSGKQLTKHKMISSELKVDFFFAKPYHSWERGANENTNGLIRQYFPKKTSFENLSEHDIKRVEDVLNNRPRKKLNFLTPNEFLLRNLSN